MASMKFQCMHYRATYLRLRLPDKHTGQTVAPHISVQDQFFILNVDHMHSDQTILNSRQLLKLPFSFNLL